MPTASILSIQVGKPRAYLHEAYPDDQSREWTSGIHKEAVSGPVHLAAENLAGDRQADLEVHGGPDRAVLVFSQLHYAGWETELGRSLPFGAFGENLTVDSLVEDDVCLGDVWEAAVVRLEVSQPRLPCYKLARRLGSKGANQKVMAAMAGGWYCRTLKQGHIQAGEKLRLVERPHPQWTVRRAFWAFVFEKEHPENYADLSGIAALSSQWKELLSSRLANRSRP